MGAGRSRDMLEFDDADGDFQELDQSDDERITLIIDRSIKTILDESREETERMTALEILGHVTYVSDVRGVMLIGKYLPFILSLIDLRRQPHGSIICHALQAISEIGFEMSEIQEALSRLNGYEIILSHIHNNYKPNEEMSQENEVICKWAAYCLCCCLGDVLEPLQYVKGEITNLELKWLATTTWECIWGRNWGLCLAKLLGKTKSFRKPITNIGASSEEDLEGCVDDSKIAELDPATLSLARFRDHSDPTPPVTPPKHSPKQSPKHSPPAPRKVIDYESLRHATFDPIQMQPWAFHSRDENMSQGSDSIGNVIPAERKSSDTSSRKDRLSPSVFTSSPARSSLMPQRPSQLSTLSTGEVRMAKDEDAQNASKIRPGGNARKTGDNS